jgi:hypothetical protein
VDPNRIETLLGSIMYTQFGRVKIDAKWNDVGQNLQKAPGLILIVSDEKGNLAGLLESNMARSIIELPGTIGDRAERLIKATSAVPNLPVSSALSAMIDAGESRWYIVREGKDLRGVVSPHAIFSAYSGAGLVGFNLYGVPLDIPIVPILFKCQGQTVHSFNPPLKFWNRFSHPICKYDQTELVQVP